MIHPWRFYVCLAVMAASGGSAHAYCLSKCPTDDSVCDLNRESGYWLSVQMQRRYDATIMSRAASREEVANIYIRVATGIVLENCRPGQLLIYHDGISDATTEAVVSGLFSRFCRVADIRRESWRGPATFSVSGDIEAEHRRAQCEITKWALLNFEWVKRYGG